MRNRGWTSINVTWEQNNKLKVPLRNFVLNHTIFSKDWNTDKRKLWLNASSQKSAIWISNLGFSSLWQPGKIFFCFRTHCFAVSFILHHPWVSQVFNPSQICTENCQSPPIFTPHKWSFNLKKLKKLTKTDKSQQTERKETKGLTFVEIVNY